jgi:hypothetical protein
MSSHVFEEQCVEESNEDKREAVSPSENAGDKHFCVFVISQKVEAAGCEESGKKS